MLHEADVYVQPSVLAHDGQMEGVPVALMEAMAARVPVVATALSGVPELVQDQQTGCSCNPGRHSACTGGPGGLRDPAGHCVAQQSWCSDSSRPSSTSCERP
jgi:glycosyltransferase involved in cell wall biosynthesis